VYNCIGCLIVWGSTLFGLFGAFGTAPAGANGGGISAAEEPCGGMGLVRLCLCWS
jgi:hypothetical protein